MSIVIGTADGATAIINLLIRRAFPYAFILELTPPPSPPPPSPRDPYKKKKKKNLALTKIEP